MTAQIPSLDLPSRLIATFGQDQEEEEGGGRRRHELWSVVADLVSRPDLFWWKNEETRREVVRLFKAYQEDVREKVLVISDEVNEAFVLPYKTRADPEYIREMRQKLRPLKRIRSDRAVMMTLTTDPSRWGSLRDAYRGQMKNFHRLMSWLVKRYGCPLQYFEAPEFTKSGIPHLHAVILGVTHLVDQEDLSREWSKLGQGKVVDLRRCGQGFRNSSVFHYVMKYVEKAWDIHGDVPENLFHVAALWALNGRSFSVSRGLLQVKKRVSQGFTYLGSFAKDVVEGLFEKAVEWGRMAVEYSRLCAVLSVDGG